MAALLGAREAYDGAGGDWWTPWQGLVYGSGIFILDAPDESKGRIFATRGNFARGKASLEVLRGWQSARKPTVLHEGRARLNPARPRNWLFGISHAGRRRRCRMRLAGTRSKAQTGGRECECSEDFDEFHDSFPSFRSRLLRGTLAKPNHLTTTTSQNHASCSQSYSMVLSRFSFDPSLGTQEIRALV